jgi:hypothetical protein
MTTSKDIKQNLATETVVRIEKYYQLNLGSMARDIIVQGFEKLRDGCPRIVCLCGSTRFGEAFREWNLRETIAGKIVLSIGGHLKSDSDLMASGLLKESDKAAFDELHKRKIDLCDEVFVLNVGGYIGDSTRSEIEYATQCGKPIRYLEAVSDECVKADMAITCREGI